MQTITIFIYLYFIAICKGLFGQLENQKKVKWWLVKLIQDVFHSNIFGEGHMAISSYNSCYSKENKQS